ncbi:hypothetical protein [Rhizobium sp. WYCCWR 11128]|uniref:hypothetical protein n=1 Tax=Rhizobium sp. WYCCWR 11128 TaxID=2749832 RepID=UPI0015D3BAAE|nr:hypothetical protein [Rhizobium sp. WYCCWR 11128]NYT33904.1 hypothetical protein [Rhizobium sp. WYCCWR 11128]
MEDELRAILLSTAEAYAAVARCGMTTVARRVKNNAAFFKRLSDPTTSFTARSFDEVMEWFADNWPRDCQRPLELLQWVKGSQNRSRTVTA